MPYQKPICVSNPSPYERSDYVELDLSEHEVPGEFEGRRLDETTLRLYRIWPGDHAEEIPYQIDHPFGPQSDHRVMTFISRATPAGANHHYREASATFRLEEGPPCNFSATLSTELLKIEHYSRPGVFDKKWDPAAPLIGAKVGNGGDLDPYRHPRTAVEGLQVYFNLVPRPQQDSPVNYAGAATSILHHRAWQHDPGMGEMLAVYREQDEHAPAKRWGQLTAIEFYSLPWERRWYHTESLLGQPGQEPAYTLAWSKTGPLRATVSLRSRRFFVRYGGAPMFQPDEVVLPCQLYRLICFYPRKEFYTEQLIVNFEGENPASLGRRLSLAFRARYYSYIDYPVRPEPARLPEDIPDYFAVWRHFGTDRRGYAFACDSHIRNFKAAGAEITWRLQVGHDHRCVHLFAYHGFHNWPVAEINPLQEVGHTAWYEWLYKPLQAIPLKRYVMQ